MGLLDDRPQRVDFADMLRRFGHRRATVTRTKPASIVTPPKEAGKSEPRIGRPFQGAFGKPKPAADRATRNPIWFRAAFTGSLNRSPCPGSSDCHDPPSAW